MNTTVLLLLITPLFFAFGWIAGRIDMKTVINQAKSLPKRMFDSIDSLIDNKSGLATVDLQDIVDQEPQLTELQISLGKLYRNRGENDLAIKLHNKLLNSQYIFSTENKDQVRLELALDFQKAGLIDRAESLLLRLVNSELYSHRAQELLLDIYQQDKNWNDAIETAQKLATSDYSYHTEVAQFHCELAQESIIKSDNKSAINHTSLALEINRKCVRANILLGDIHYSNENYLEALNKWQSIEKQNYLFLPMVVDKMFDAYIRLNKIKEGLTLIQGYMTLYPQLNLSEFLYQKLLQYETPETTLTYLRTIIKNHPSSKVAALIIDLHLNISKSNLSQSKSDAQVIKDLLLRYSDKLSSHRCGRCNFKAKTFFWQCPACYEWESISPNNSEN